MGELRGRAAERTTKPVTRAGMIAIIPVWTAMQIVTAWASLRYLD
jgi:hypothetical protein